MDRARNIQKIQELRKEMKEKEAEHVKAIQKYAAEAESMKGQVRIERKVWRHLMTTAPLKYFH